MKLAALREEVLEANLEVVRRGLVLYTFGNASGIDRREGLVVIKPSGVPYEGMKASDLVVVDLVGRVVEGHLKPSSDLPTHLVLYKAFTEIRAVVHTHSHAATSWAQAQREIPCLGTTHADYFHGSVPITDALTPQEIESDYETNTGHVIVKRFAGVDPLHTPAVLVAGHAPFCWAKSAAEAAHVAVVLEQIATMALNALSINPEVAALARPLHDKHFFRKHGAKAYYGQAKESGEDK
jgi:L-ribulose-5-phosphate 4-epimerase